MRQKGFDNNDINIFLSVENPRTLLLAKEKTWKSILTLVVNYPKIVQKNKLCHPKQQKIGYLIIYAVYLLIALFDFKIGSFKKQL